MITIVILISGTLIFLTVAKMQLDYKSAKQAHSAKIEVMKAALSHVLSIQDELCGQVSIVNQFNTDYKKAKEKLSSEIFLLQYDLFKSISKNNSNSTN